MLWHIKIVAGLPLMLDKLILVRLPSNRRTVMVSEAAAPATSHKAAAHLSKREGTQL